MCGFRVVLPRLSPVRSAIPASEICGGSHGCSRERDTVHECLRLARPRHLRPGCFLHCVSHGLWSSPEPVPMTPLPCACLQVALASLLVSVSLPRSLLASLF